MRTGLFGFIAGAAATSLAVWLIVSDGEPTIIRAQIEMPSSDLTVSTSVPEAAPPPRVNTHRNEPTNQAGLEIPIPTPVSPLMPEDDATRAARLPLEIGQAQQRLAELRSELEEMSIANDLASQPVVSPVLLPPEFDALGANTYRAYFHERMQNAGGPT